MDISFTVRLSVCVCVCTGTDFSSEDKASGVRFCTVVRRRLGQQGMSLLGNFVPLEAQNRTNRPARKQRIFTVLVEYKIRSIYSSVSAQAKRRARDALFVVKSRGVWT